MGRLSPVWVFIYHSWYTYRARWWLIYSKCIYKWYSLMQIRHYSCWELIEILFILSSFSTLHTCSSSLPTRPGRTCGFWSAPLTLGKHTSHGSSSPVSNRNELFITVLMCYTSLKKSFVNIVWPSVNALWEWKCGLSEKGQVLDSSFCSLALWFANTHIVLFCLSLKAISSVGVGHNPGNNNYTPWMAFGGLTLSA